MDKSYILSEKYEKIGEEVRAKRFPELRDCKIAWVESDFAKRSKRKITRAECFKVRDEYKWTCEYDFFIVVYEPNVLFFSDEQIRTLLRHELEHVGYDGILMDYWTNPHDVEEFRDIIDEEGLDWAKIDWS